MVYLANIISNLHFFWESKILFYFFWKKIMDRKTGNQERGWFRWGKWVFFLNVGNVIILYSMWDWWAVFWSFPYIISIYKVLLILSWSPPLVPPQVGKVKNSFRRSWGFEFCCYFECIAVTLLDPPSREES